jgi:hypothetical protein
MAKHERQVQIPASPEAVTQRLYEALASLKGASAPLVQGQWVTTNLSVSAMSWGERVSAYVQAAPGGCVVTVRSASAFALVDWGKNKKNVTKVLAWIVPAAPPAASGPH